MIKILSLISTALFTVTGYAAAPVTTAEVFQFATGKTEFYAIGKPSMLKIHGTANSLEGTLSKTGADVSGKFTVKMSEFNSGLSLRDSHTKKKVFEIEKYPTSELTLKSFMPKSGEKTKFTGTLKFHGVEREVQGEATVKLEKDKAGIEANFNILLTDFNVQPPEFAGMKINNEVKVEVSGESSK